MIKITAIDLRDDKDDLFLGEFDSVQLTGRALRGPDDEAIAWLDDGQWRIEADLRLGFDIVIEEGGRNG